MHPDDLFAVLDSPEPPAALRALTLERATRALAAAPVPDLWTRLWESRNLRVAWAAAAMLLVASHLALTLDQRRPNPTRVAAAPVDTELTDLTRLPRLRLDLQPMSAALAGASDRSQPSSKETRS